MGNGMCLTTVSHLNATRESLAGSSRLCFLSVCKLTYDWRAAHRNSCCGLLAAACGWFGVCPNPVISQNEYGRAARRREETSPGLAWPSDGGAGQSSDGVAPAPSELAKFSQHYFRGSLSLRGLWFRALPQFSRSVAGMGTALQGQASHGGSQSPPTPGIEKDFRSPAAEWHPGARAQGSGYGVHHISRPVLATDGRSGPAGPAGQESRGRVDPADPWIRVSRRRARHAPGS